MGGERVFLGGGGEEEGRRGRKWNGFCRLCQAAFVRVDVGKWKKRRGEWRIKLKKTSTALP